jgi:GNAT superfamily N-acetyltransferase
MMNLQVRPMLLEDAGRISELAEQLGYPSSSGQTQHRIKEVLQAADHCAFIAIADGYAVGWIHAFKTFSIESDPFIQIAGLVVDENYRGKGVGKQLVEKVKEWALSKNFYEIRVRSNSKRLESHLFYPALGFVETKEQKVYKLLLH